MRTSIDIIGRVADRAAIDDWLDDGGSRVATLRGPGGVGKTTLAALLARERNAPFVELDVCTTVDDVLSALGDLLALPTAHRDRPSIDAALANVELLVLDNAEHLVAAIAALIDDLPSSITTQFLVTSQLSQTCSAPGCTAGSPSAIARCCTTISRSRRWRRPTS